MESNHPRAAAVARTALLGLVALLASASCALAANTAVVGPSGAAFYTPPSSLPSGPHGTLVWYRTATVALGSGAPAVQSWNILYETEDALGAQDVATGTLLVPTASYAGTRPVIDYAVGTQGLGQGCAPSEQLAAGTEYETANIVALLKQGWAVVLTDYQGYTTGSESLYTVGAAEGHAVLDAVTAADQIPGTGVSPYAKVALWGYSQGGQAAAWAAQLQPSYDPSLSLVGAAMGGIPADLETTANYLNGSIGAGFAAMAIVGLSDQYPNDIPLASLENANGAAQIANIKTQCVFQSLLGYEDVNLDQYTVGGETLAQLEANPQIAAAIDAQQLGTVAPKVPVYQYHGQADELVPLAQDIALKQQYCSEHVADEFVLYPGEHITTQFQAAPAVISWIQARLGLFGDLNAPSDCSETAPPPTSTANPGGGDFVVSLNEWPLTGTLTLGSFGGDVVLPSGATFSGNTDLTTQQLQAGTVSIPTFTASALTFLGLKVDPVISLTESGQATGSASLSTSGTLVINGGANVTIGLSSINLLGLTIKLGSTCQTSTPVSLPLSFSGPVSSLGDGELTFSGKATLPRLTGCGLYTPLLNLLFPGSNNTYTLTVSPPAAVNW